MNYQPSFARATRAAFHGPLEELDRIVQERQAGAAQNARESASRSLPSRQIPDKAQRSTGKRGHPFTAHDAEPQRERPRRRVPDHDIVYVGAHPVDTSSTEPVDVRDLAYLPSDNESDIPDGSPTLRRVLIALLAAAITTVGGIYFGQRYAESHVIVVPTTVDGNSVIT